MLILTCNDYKMQIFTTEIKHSICGLKGLDVNAATKKRIEVKETVNANDDDAVTEIKDLYANSEKQRKDLRRREEDDEDKGLTEPEGLEEKRSPPPTPSPD
jgi:hypothetical protein